MPAQNPQRRAQIADAAIALLAESGVHGVTHRAVDRTAGLPEGTTSNYFRSREALLVAATERVAELHHAHLDAAASSWIANGPPVALDTSSQMIELITASLMRAVTADRARYLAVFELRLESRRRPALADALGAVVAAALPTVAAHHAQLGLAVAVDRIPVLIQLYGGILFTLVTDPADHADPAAVRALVTAAVRGALS